MVLFVVNDQQLAEVAKGYTVSLTILCRCRDCRWLGRESIVPGEYRCNRTERVTGLDDYCSKAVRRDG